MTQPIFYILLFLLLFTTILFLFLCLRWRWKYKKLLKKSLHTANAHIELVEKASFAEQVSGNPAEDRILLDLQNLFENEKIYLNPSLTLGDLAKQIGTSKSVLSHTINTKVQRNFPSLLNEYRVNEAIRLLKDNKTQHYKMEAIAEMCGYRNRQVFHSAFKKHVGVPPLQFRDLANKSDEKNDN